MGHMQSGEGRTTLGICPVLCQTHSVSWMFFFCGRKMRPSLCHLSVISISPPFTSRKVARHDGNSARELGGSLGAPRPWFNTWSSVTSPPVALGWRLGEKGGHGEGGGGGVVGGLVLLFVVGWGLWGGVLAVVVVVVGSVGWGVAGSVVGRAQI